MNNVKYVSGNIVILKKCERENLLSLGYKQLSINTYSNGFNHIIMIKSFVSSSNPNEWKYLSITSKIYKKIKDKNITILMFERETNISIFHKKYQIKINSLTPTQSVRNTENDCTRFILNESTKEKNIISEIYEGFESVS